MDFIVSLETTEDYKSRDVVNIIKNALESGLLSVKVSSKGTENKIINDLLDNSLIVERV